MQTTLLLDKDNVLLVYPCGGGRLVMESQAAVRVLSVNVCDQVNVRCREKNSVKVVQICVIALIFMD